MYVLHYSARPSTHMHPMQTWASSETPRDYEVVTGLGIHNSTIISYYPTVFGAKPSHTYPLPHHPLKLPPLCFKTAQFATKLTGGKAHAYQVKPCLPTTSYSKLHQLTHTKSSLLYLITLWQRFYLSMKIMTAGFSGFFGTTKGDGGGAREGGGSGAEEGRSKGEESESKRGESENRGGGSGRGKEEGGGKVGGGGSKKEGRESKGGEGLSRGGGAPTSPVHRRALPAARASEIPSTQKGPLALSAPEGSAAPPASKELAASTKSLKSSIWRKIRNAAASTASPIPPPLPPRKLPIILIG